MPNLLELLCSMIFTLTPWMSNWIHPHHHHHDPHPYSPALASSSISFCFPDLTFIGSSSLSRSFPGHAHLISDHRLTSSSVNLPHISWRTLPVKPVYLKYSTESIGEKHEKSRREREREIKDHPPPTSLFLSQPTIFRKTFFVTFLEM